MSYETELLTSEELIAEKQNNKTSSVVEQVRARKRGNAENHPQYNQQDRLAAIHKLITGE